MRFSLSKMVRPTLKFDSDVEVGYGFQEPFLKSVATTALMMVFTSSNRDKNLEVQLTPSVRVRTTADLSDEALVPFGAIGKSTSEDADGVVISLSQRDVRIASFQVTKPGKGGHDVEFWRVRESDDGAKSNMNIRKSSICSLPRRSAPSSVLTTPSS